MNDEQLEELRTPVPGPRTRELMSAVQAFESRNVTFVHRQFPIFWDRAHGATVTNVDGNRYLDLTAAFGVANAGHTNPRVVAALHEQAQQLMHGMGDVHPTPVKTRLLQRLAELAPGNLSKVFLASTGSEAVEAALKTAIVATGKSTFVAYRGAYHGLSLGALQVSGIEKFRAPFAGAIRETALFLDYPQALHEIDAVRELLDNRAGIAAIIIEPVQARGGCLVAPAGYLQALRDLCRSRGVLLIFDEIYTGFGRTGTMFACEYEGVVPDMLCVGKAMASGFPISAMIAAPSVMDAWPLSEGEALHTSTYLGNPMGCAAALATIADIEELRLDERARELGRLLEERLRLLVSRGKALAVRGRGLMWGIELSEVASAQGAVIDALRRGVIVLQSGVHGNVLSITPPLTIAQRQLFRAIDLLEECL